jgi:hypothetical protein
MDRLNKTDPSVKVVARQLIRSGTGIGDNVIETQTCSNKRVFTNYSHYVPPDFSQVLKLTPLKWLGTVLQAYLT